MSSLLQLRPVDAFFLSVFLFFRFLPSGGGRGGCYRDGIIQGPSRPLQNNQGEAAAHHELLREGTGDHPPTIGEREGRKEHDLTHSTVCVCVCMCDAVNVFARRNKSEELVF